MITPNSIAAKRPLEWCLINGDEVLCVGEEDFYQNNPPQNYSFIPAISSGIDILLNSPESTTEKIADLRKLQIEQLQKLVKEFQPDVIHGHYFSFTVECCALANLHPLVVSVWGFLNDLMSSEAERLFKFYPEIRPIIESSDALIVETPILLDKCQPFLKSNQRLELIPLGTNTQHFSPYDGENVD